MTGAESTGTVPLRSPGRKLRQLAELPCSVLKGVGSGSVRELSELGIESVLDLLTHYPHRYIDGTRLVPVGELAIGEKASVLAEVRRVARPATGYGRGRSRGPARVVLEVADASSGQMASSGRSASSGQAQSSGRSGSSGQMASSGRSGSSGQMASSRRAQSSGQAQSSGRAGPSGSGQLPGIHDGLEVVFFNQTWRVKQLPVGTLALFYGSVGWYRDSRQMVNPTVEVLRSGADTSDSEPAPHSGRVFPVYPLTEKADLTSNRIGRYVAEALDRAKEFSEPLPVRWRERFQLTDRTAALNHIHRPATMAEVEPARKRLAFDELFRLQLALVLRQQRLQQDARGICHVVARPDRQTLVEQYLRRLPFELTEAQRSAIETIRADLARPIPMHRLLQGDVGAGKTVVAVAALLTAVEGGHQGALMAPTEVLAEQHHAGVRRLLEGMMVPDTSTLSGERPLRVALLTNRTPAGERSELHAGLAAGTVDILIGTHALLTDVVRFASLGAVVIDEQHRFGVEQRARLKAKGRGVDGSGRDPDLLVMTATPIPRTAAMVVFGDLDMTVITELPPGRTPIETRWAKDRSDVDAAWQRVRAEVGAGHRAYVVCPLVEGSERVEATAVTDEAQRLATAELSGLRLGVLHGQMRNVAKETTMADFRSGAIDVLVATTVIEVGVDVPDATVMVIEDADRFGIAQLHQLRGRVGRGADPSWCFLLSESDSPEATTRLSAMERTTDGFELADVDLGLRGEGSILGARQKGRSDLKLARLISDRELVFEAREMAEAIVAADPSLEQHPLLADELRLLIDDEEAEFLFKS